LPWERLLLLGLGVLCVACSAQVVGLWPRLGLIAAGGIMLGLTFRVDAQNVMNHPNPGAPNLNVNSGTFGEINSKTGNRTLQGQVRFQF